MATDPYEPYSNQKIEAIEAAAAKFGEDMIMPVPGGVVLRLVATIRALQQDLAKAQANAST